jgi:hypothetical protein
MRESTHLNMTIAVGVLALVLIALTKGRLGYRPESQPVSVHST